MAGAFVPIEIDGGISSLKCPITGMVVIDEENGFDVEAEHSPHLRFFADWIGNIYVADPADLPAEQAEYQARLIDWLEETRSEPDMDAMNARCVEILPSSALLLQFMDPPQGSSDGSVCHVCFDLRPARDWESIRLRELL